MSDDPYGLSRFVEAQAWWYARVLDELAAGEKASHWMWFISPQLKGVGSGGPLRQLSTRRSGVTQSAGRIRRLVAGA